MKYIKISVLFLFVSLVFIACDSNQEFKFDSTCYSIFTARKLESGVWNFIDDTGKYTYTPNSAIELADTMVGHRFYVNFNYLTPDGENAYKMDLNYVVPVSMLPLKSVESAYEIQRLGVTKFSLFDAWATYKYANFVVDYYGSDIDKHQFSLARVDTASVVDSVATLYLCHNAGADSGTSGFSSIFSTDITSISADEGVKALRIIFTNANGATDERVLQIYRY